MNLQIKGGDRQVNEVERKVKGGNWQVSEVNGHKKSGTVPPIHKKTVQKERTPQGSPS